MSDLSDTRNVILQVYLQSVIAIVLFKYICLTFKASISLHHQQKRARLTFTLVMNITYESCVYHKSSMLIPMRFCFVFLLAVIYVHLMHKVVFPQVRRYIHKTKNWRERKQDNCIIKLRRGVLGQLSLSTLPSRAKMQCINKAHRYAKQYFWFLC